MGSSRRSRWRRGDCVAVLVLILTLSASTALALPSGSETVVAVGDISPEPFWPQTDDVATSNLAISLHPNRVLTLGDLQYEGATIGRLTSPTGYAQSWGRDPLMNHTCPAAGNHEYADPSTVEPGAPGFFTYFGPRLQACATAPGSRPDRGFYAYDLSNGWHIVVLSSDCRRTDGTGPHCVAASDQYRWLRSDLARVKARGQQCTLATFHHPRWASGYTTDDTRVHPFWIAFQDYHVDVVLNGHEHHYARYGPMRANGALGAAGAGTRQFTVGTGGRSVNPFRRAPHPGYRYRLAGKFGVLRMVLTGNANGSGSWTSSFRTPAGGVLDSAAAGCWR
jgi:acid phosphatase type 7